MVADILRPITFTQAPRSAEEAANVIDCALATAAYAARTACHTTLGISPGAMVFNRDMLLDLPLIADFELLRERRQLMVNRNLLRANKNRRYHDYRVNERVLKLVYEPGKLDPRALGPYTITRVHVNGTVTIRLSPLVTERINIRQIKPCMV